MRWLVLFLLAGCSTPPIERGGNYDERIRRDTMKCIRILRQDGFAEELIYPICKDLHSKPGVRPVEKSRKFYSIR